MLKYSVGQTTVRCNLKLYDKIRAIRLTPKTRLSDIDKCYINSITGKRIFKIKDLKMFTVVSVVKHWYWGWYYAAVLEDDDKSSMLCRIKNISCEYPEVLNGIKEFNNNYSFL